MWTLQRFHQSISHAHVSIGTSLFVSGNLIKRNLCEKFVAEKGEGTSRRIQPKSFHRRFVSTHLKVFQLTSLSRRVFEPIRSHRLWKCFNSCFRRCLTRKKEKFNVKRLFAELNLSIVLIRCECLCEIRRRELWLGCERVKRGENKKLDSTFALIQIAQQNLWIVFEWFPRTINFAFCIKLKRERNPRDFKIISTFESLIHLLVSSRQWNHSSRSPLTCFWTHKWDRGLMKSQSRFERCFEFSALALTIPLSHKKKLDLLTTQTEVSCRGKMLLHNFIRLN